MSKITEYQKAVQEHMEDAPKELRDYVCKRLNEGNTWSEGLNPIIHGVTWFSSNGSDLFWSYVVRKNWDTAMNTEFWIRTIKWIQNYSSKVEAIR